MYETIKESKSKINVAKAHEAHDNKNKLVLVSHELQYFMKRSKKRKQQINK